MRRLVTLFSAAALSLVGGVIGTSAAASGATDTTIPSSAGSANPIVGTWMISDTSDPEEGPSGAMFSSDGTMVSLDSDGASLGVWEQTGPTAVALMFTGYISAEEVGGGGGSFTIRATLEVDPDGQSFSGDYTVEVNIEGMPTGQYGPGSVTGTRVPVEPMGTPVGSIDDLFGSFEGTQVTSGTAISEGTEVAAPPTTS